MHAFSQHLINRGEDMDKLHWIKNPSVNRPNAYFYVAFVGRTKYTIVKLGRYSSIWHVYQEHMKDGQQKVGFAKTAKQGMKLAESWISV